jgi:hypothetical protein
MIDARFRPLDRPAKLPMERARFDSKYSATLDLLEAELRHLSARSITILAGFRLEQIRNDGWPRGSSSPEHPAAEIHFTSRGKQLAFKCHRFSRFEDNLRAIALSLEALRKVDRYSVSDQAQQYTGWAQLPAAGESDSLQKAVTLLVLLAGEGHSKERVLANQEAATAAYRAAAKRVHPDTNPGAPRSSWDALQAAKEQLDAYFAARGGGK